MHFLQTTAWEEFQTKLGRQTFRMSGEDWEYLAILERGTGNNRLYCPYGPYAKTKESFGEAIESLIDLGKKHSVTFVRIEPTDTSFLPYLKTNKWRSVTYQSLNPELTQVIDLTQTEEQIIANMSQPSRNIYRNYRKKGLEVKTSQKPSDIEIFIELIHKVAARTGMRPHSDEYFRTQAETLFPVNSAKLWYVTFEGAPVSAALLYDDQTTRYYAHAASDNTPELRKLNAGTALVAEAIIDAKHRGLSSFDLYGIAPANGVKHHAWRGFTRFKKSFGGHELEFCGTWELPLKPLAYQVYRTYQSIRK